MSKQEFYQAKYEYYRSMNMCVVIAACVLSVAYFFSDCYLFGRFTTATLLARMAIILPFLVFMWANKRTKDYRIMVTMTYVFGHSVMWCTIWACYYLEDLRYACVGFFIILFCSFILGIAAPISGAVVGQGFLFVDISIANTFLHYPDFAMMFLLGIPLYIGICVFDVAIERTFRDQLVMKKKLEENLKHDMLTGAYNRNLLTSLVDEGNHFVRDAGEQMAVALYDLDKFKHVNDTYGHVAGDEVLVKVTEAVRSKLNPSEYLVRWGGEEFIIVMKNRDGNFKAHVQEFRKAVEQLELAVGKITISIGVAVYDGGDYQKTIKNADTALYEAKNNGRNQVVIYQE